VAARGGGIVVANAKPRRGRATLTGDIDRFDTGTTCDADIERLRSLSCIKWSRYDNDVIPAWVADMDLAPAPVAVEAVASLAACGDFGYNFSAAMRLPEAFSAWEERRHGWAPDPEKIRVFCDVMQAVETVLWLHTEPGDGVVLFTPVYHPFYPAITSTGRRIVPVALDDAPGWRLDPDRLSAAIDSGTRAILLCNPQNPLGRVLDAEELGAIAAVAEKHDLLVVSDEIWCDLVHPGAVHVPMASIGDDIASRTVTISAASKAFNIAGLHCAVAHIGHAGVQAALEKLPRHLLGAVGSPGAEATLAAWTAGEPWLEEVRAHLTSQRDHLTGRLATELPSLGFTPPEATYLAWLDLRAFDLGDDPAKAILERGRVALSSGLDFGEAGAGWARLNFATSREILDEIVNRIVSAVR